MKPKQYRVLSRLKVDGDEYSPGDTIELTPRDAEAMPWAVEPAGGKKAVAEEPAAAEDAPESRADNSGFIINDAPRDAEANDEKPQRGKNK